MKQSLWILILPLLAYWSILRGDVPQTASTEPPTPLEVLKTQKEAMAASGQKLNMTIYVFEGLHTLADFELKIELNPTYSMTVWPRNDTSPFMHLDAGGLSYVGSPATKQFHAFSPSFHTLGYEGVGYTEVFGELGLQSHLFNDLKDDRGKPIPRFLVPLFLGVQQDGDILGEMHGSHQGRRFEAETVHPFRSVWHIPHPFGELEWRLDFESPVPHQKPDPTGPKRLSSAEVFFSWFDEELDKERLIEVRIGYGWSPANEQIGQRRKQKAEATALLPMARLKGYEPKIGPKLENHYSGFFLGDALPIVFEDGTHLSLADSFSFRPTHRVTLIAQNSIPEAVVEYLQRAVTEENLDPDSLQIVLFGEQGSKALNSLPRECVKTGASLVEEFDLFGLQEDESLLLISDANGQLLYFRRITLDMKNLEESLLQFQSKLESLKELPIL